MDYNWSATIITPFNRLCQSQIRFELIVPVLFFSPDFCSWRFMRTQWTSFLRRTQSRCCSQHSATKHRLLSCLMLHTFWFDFFTLLGWRMCSTGSVWDVSLPFLSHRQKGGRRCSVTPMVDPSPGTLDSLSSHCDFLHRNVWWLTWPPPPNFFSSLFD